MKRNKSSKMVGDKSKKSEESESISVKRQKTDKLTPGKIEDLKCAASLPNHNINEVCLSIPYKDKKIPALLNSPESKVNNEIWVILTHGAGGDLNTPQLKAVAAFLVAKNFTVCRFTCKGLNIKYRTNVFCEIVKFIHTSYNPKKIFVGGRSMGARASVMLLSNENCDLKAKNKIAGVICLSYPLHQVNNTKELRDIPLLELDKPAFFLSGDNDEMCHKQTFSKVLNKMTAAHQVQWLEGYDHSARSTCGYKESIYIDSLESMSKWCLELCKG